MFEQFNELMTSLNDECIERVNEDLSLLESSMKSVLDAWTDYIFARDEAPNDEESKMYHRWLKIVTRW